MAVFLPTHPPSGTPHEGHPHRPAGIYEWQRALALLVFASALGLYVLTLAPTVVAMFDDSLEFQLVPYLLAIAHPTGYPLYTLLGWLFTRVPVRDVAYRVNLLSAVFGAITVALVYLIVLELTIPRTPWPAPGQPDIPKRRPWAEALAGLIAALALAISAVFWSQATVAEVYTLNATFVAGILWLLTWSERAEPTDGNSHPKRWLLALAFVFGLSLTHHRTMLLMIPAVIFQVWHVSRIYQRRVRSAANAPEIEISRSGSAPKPRLAASRRCFAKLALAFGAPLLLYLYLPLRGHVGSLDGGYANTLAGFWQHVSASGYGAFIFQNPFGAERGGPFYLALFVGQFGWVGLAVGLLGIVALGRRGELGLTGIAFITYLAFNLFYRVADIQVFFITLFVIWAIWIGVALGWLLAGPRWRTEARVPWLQRSICVLLVLLMAGQSLVSLLNNLPAQDRSGDWSVHDYGLDVMVQPLEAGAAIVGILGEVTLLRYFQATQALRPDLMLIPADREAERLATVAGLVDEGRPVYLTRELPGAPANWSLSAVGPLIQVSPQPVLQPPASLSPIEASPNSEIALHSFAITRPSAHSTLYPVRLTLVWQSKALSSRDLKISARLVDPAGQLVAQADAVPVHFAYPTSAWRPGEYIRDVYDLALPPGLQPGDYTPVIILYDPSQGATEVGQVTLPPVSLP